MPSNPKANDSSQSHSSHSPYRDLDQSKNEIRFLPILLWGPTPSSAKSLEFGDDAVRCRLEYHDFEKFIAEANKREPATEEMNGSTTLMGRYPEL
jgi:hypothetical protein